MAAEIKPILTKLYEDPEFDVRYFADEAKQSNIRFVSKGTHFCHKIFILALRLG